VPGATVVVRNDAYISGVLTDVVLPQAIENKPLVYMRWICTTTVSANDGTVASTGTSRLDVTIYKAVEVTTPTLFANPTTLNFGDVQTGQTSDPKTLTVSGAALTGNINYAKSGDGATAFSIEETDWNPATGGTLAVTFSPTAIENYTAIITLSSQGAENVTVSLSGAGAQPTGELIAKWNDYEPSDPYEPVFITTGGSDANEGVTLIRESEAVKRVVNADSVAASTDWADPTATEKYWMATFSTVGYTDITFTSKQRGSNKGPKDFKVQYKVGAGTWADVAGGEVTVANDNYVSGKLELVVLPEETNHQPEVYLRWLCTSAVSIDGSAITSAGVNRLDVSIYGVTATAPFVPVSDIINLTSVVAVNVPTTLTGTVIPTNATNKTIVWSVKDDPGGIGATINGNIFTATGIGTAVITATIADGLDIGEPFIKDYVISVVEELTTYVISATVNNPDFGEIDPAGVVEVEEGGTRIFNITPYANYKIKDVLVNGYSEGAITTYTFNDVQEDGTIYVIFEQLSVNDSELSKIHVYSHLNSIYIKNETNVEIKSVEVFDMMGRMIYQNNATTTITLNVANGVYHVRLISQDGKSVNRKISIMK
jgi:hypothetical protein